MVIEDSPTRSKKCTWILILLSLIVAPPTEGTTKEKLAEFVRSGHSAWDSNDVDAIVNAFAKYDAKLVGFGYRTAPWWDGSSRSEDAYRKAIVQFFDQMEHYRTEFKELHTSVDGDIGRGTCNHDGC